jgi:Ca-activated chloride channel homolog
MNFLTPAAFALAALLPVLIAMYLLRLRRSEQVISSVYLWRRMVRDVEANAPWQRLRRNLLLLLQLLFLLALIFALARPFTWAEGAGGHGLILVVDTSASMAATDVAATGEHPSRLEAAKATARSLVDGLPDGARTTLIAAGAHARVMIAASQDRRQIHQALNGLRPGTAGSDLAAALALASAISARQPDTEIAVLSDFSATNTPDQAALPPVAGPIRYLTVGDGDNNQAISTLSIQPAAGGLTAFAQVSNYAGSPARRRLILRIHTGHRQETSQVFNAFDLEIPAHGRQAVVAEDLPAETRILEAHLAGEDLLAVDDRAWAVYRDTPSVAATLVTGGNRFLETALALLPGLEVTTVHPDDYANSSGLPTHGASHFTIFDGHVPITATLPSGNLLFIGPPRSTDLFTITGILEQPIPRAVADDPLLAHVDLAAVGILEAARISLPDWARVVVAGGGEDETPLLMAGERDGRRLAVLAFDLRNSDLPLQVAFPLLLANLTGWLAPGSNQIPTEVEPGAPVNLLFPPDVASVTITRPDGTAAQLLPERGRAIFAETGQLGVFQVAWGETGRASFAVNLYAPQESNVRPGEPPSTIADDQGGSADPLQARREWWRPLAYLALALLLAEWLVYQRGTLARVWSHVNMARLRRHTTLIDG